MFNFEAFAVTGAAARNTISIKDLSVEEARAHVKVVDGNTKKPVEGYQGLTLKLGRVKISLDAVAPKAVKLQVPEAQVEEVSTALLEQVEAGTFDEAINEGLVKLNTAAEPRSAAAPEGDAGLEGFEEDELVA